MNGVTSLLRELYPISSANMNTMLGFLFELPLLLFLRFITCNSPSEEDDTSPFVTVTVDRLFTYTMLPTKPMASKTAAYLTVWTLF